jgi:hypothetical protein
MTGHANLSLTDEEWEGVMNVYNVLKGMRNAAMFTLI